ncbi:unnamed protein product, partial [Meganyctiphanes norvegica]
MDIERMSKLSPVYTSSQIYQVVCMHVYVCGKVKNNGHLTEVVWRDRGVQEGFLKFNFGINCYCSCWWEPFRPTPLHNEVAPGETALAFYTAKNPTDRPVIGVSTYNVVPFDAGQYFNKIQCFCFEEQMLNPKEEVNMPVFFYIDPEFADDPKMENVDLITLSYTFFEVREGLQLPIPQFARS